VFSRAEAIEDEEGRMSDMVSRLQSIAPGGSPESMDEARRIISMLSEMNNRWNSKELRAFLIARQRDLFF